MAGGVVAPLHEAEKFAQFGRFVVNKATEVLFDDAVEHFRLTVALRVVSRAHAQLGTT